MYPMLEPFLYEAVTQYQSELRAAAHPVAATTDREPTRPTCIRLRWCSRGDRLTVAPASR